MPLETVRLMGKFLDPVKGETVVRCTYTNENVTFERHCCWNYEGWHFKQNA